MCTWYQNVHTPQHQISIQIFKPEPPSSPYFMAIKLTNTLTCSSLMYPGVSLGSLKIILDRSTLAFLSDQRRIKGQITVGSFSLRLSLPGLPGQETHQQRVCPGVCTWLFNLCSAIRRRTVWSSLIMPCLYITGSLQVARLRGLQELACRDKEVSLNRQQVVSSVGWDDTWIVDPSTNTKHKYEKWCHIEIT